MAKVLRQGIDMAGGLLQGGSSNVFVNGKGIVRVGDDIAPHSHSNAKMAKGSETVFVNGKAACRENDLASCGHIGVGGSENVSVG